MREYIQFNQRSTISFSARFLLLIILLSLISSCGTVIQAPLPTKPIAETPPTMENSATMKPTSVLPTEEPTLTPTMTLTPEPSVTPTKEIDFTIPEPPQGVDPEKWREAYINGMQTSGYIRLKLEGGLVKVYWDHELNTLIWDLGTERYGYNSEFKFTGAAVNDVYGNGWIVRKRLTQSQGDANSIWNYYKLHEKGKLILGVQCVGLEFGPSCALVGQFVRKETIDLTPFLVNDFALLSDEEKGELYTDIDNFFTEFVVLRVPKLGGYAEIKIPVCPSDYCGLDTITLCNRENFTSTTGESFLNAIKQGSMLYVGIGILETDPGIDWVDVLEQVKKSETSIASFYFYEAFGNVELLSKVLNDEFGIFLHSDFVGNYVGVKVIYNLEKLAEENIIQPAGGNCK